MTYTPELALALAIALPVLILGALIFAVLAIREGNRTHRINSIEGQNR
jgi:hypothetical protein